MPNNFISNGSRLAIVYFDTCLSRKSKYLIDIVSSIRKLQNIVGKARVIPGFALGRTYMRNWQFAREAQDIVEPFLDQSISFIFEYVLCEHKTDHGICRQYGSIAELSLQFPRLACHTRNIFFFQIQPMDHLSHFNSTSSRNKVGPTCLVGPHFLEKC